MYPHQKMSHLGPMTNDTYHMAGKKAQKKTFLERVEVHFTVVL